MAALLWLLASAGLLDCTQSAPAVDWSSAPAVPLASGQLQLQQATVRVIRLSGFCNYRVALKANDTPFHAAWGVSSEWELLTRPANSTRCEVGPVHTSEHSVQHSSNESALFLIGPPHEADYGILDLRLQGTPIGCSDGSAVLPSLAQTAAVQLQLDSPASIYPLHHSGNTLGPVVDWARSQGAQLPKLVPAAFGRVRGMRALHDIGAKEVFLSIPRKLCLQVVEGESTPNPVPHLVSNRVWRLMGGGLYTDLPGQLSFLLLSEMLKGANSFWHAYVQHLPSHHNLLVRWSTSELAALQDATLVSEAVLQRTTLEDAYQMIQDEPIVQKYGITLDQVVWAACQRMSRAFNLPPRAGPLGLNPWAVGACLFPLIIMLRIPLVQQCWKHSRRAHDVCRVLLVLTMGWSLVQQRLQGSQALAFHPLSDALNHELYVKGEIRAAPFTNAIKLVAGADGIKAGSEVHISYGSLRNQEFLQSYGFTIPDSPEEAVILYLLDIEVELKMEGIGAEVLQGLRMQYATEEQMEEAAAFKPKRWLWEAVQNLELPSVAGFFKTARFNSLEQKVVQVLLDACSTELNSKPTTLGEDLDLLRKAAPAEHSRAWLALQYRIGQKQVLQNCIEEQRLRYDALRTSPWLL